MKFLVLTDLHQKKSCINWINRVITEYEPEFTIFLGDITDFGTGEDAADIINMINSEIYAIPGNCDSLDMPEKIASVAHDMHRKSVEIDGYHFAGLGGSNITIFKTPFELDEKTIYDALKPISEKGMILITHAPALGTFDHIPSGESVGSPSIRKISDEFKPILALSGHIHEDRGIKIINGTMFCNPGPAKEGYCGIVSIESKKPSIKLIGPLD